jgi:hypothetical protein
LLNKKQQHYHDTITTRPISVFLITSFHSTGQVAKGNVILFQKTNFDNYVIINYINVRLSFFIFLKHYSTRRKFEIYNYGRKTVKEIDLKQKEKKSYKI